MDGWLHSLCLFMCFTQTSAQRLFDIQWQEKIREQKDGFFQAVVKYYYMLN